MVIHLLPREHGEILGRLGEGGKSGNISETRTDREKLLWRAHRNSSTLFQMVPPSSPYGLLFPKIGGSQSAPKTSIAIISGTGKATDLKFGCYIHIQGPSEQKPITNFGEKGAWGTQELPKFFEYPLLSQERVKQRTSNFVRTFIGSIGTEAH